MSTAKYAPLLLATLAGLSGCAAPEQPAPRASYAGMHRPLAGSRLEGALLGRYRGEHGCKGPSYIAVRRYAATQLDAVVSVPTEPERVAGAMRNGRFRIALAQTAARKRCREVARDTYRQLNEIFTGERYASLRQRANAGLDALGSSPAAK